MESKKINQLATELTPALSDLTIIGDPTTGISKKITLSQMASLFTGTVEEYASVSAFPLVGVADTIYIALDTNVLYRWDTTLTSYVELSPNIINSLVFNDANGFDGTIALVGSVATLTITTALTTGSVAFIGASGALLQDNANFFWDDTNNRLGLGTNAPTTVIDAFGSDIIGRLNGTSTNNSFLGFASAGTNKWSIGNVQSDHRFRIYSEANTAELFTILPTGEIGIGIANPFANLHIDGGASVNRVIMDANINVAKIFSFRSDNSPRWALRVDGTESGSNAGADFAIRRYTDAGAFIDAPLTITRSTGNIGIGGASGSDKLTITGSIRADLGASGISAIFTGTGSNLQISHDGTTAVNFINTGGGGYVFKAGNTTSTIFSLSNAGAATFDSSVTPKGGLIFNTTQSVSTSGSIGFNSSVGIFIYGKTGTEADFRIYNASGLTVMSNTTGTQNVVFTSNVQAKNFSITGTYGYSGQIVQQADIFGGSATNLLIQSSSGNNIGFLTNGSTTFSMFINTSNNVGIGTTDPQSKLHIISALGTAVISIGETGNNTRLSIGQESSYTGNFINSSNIDLKLMSNLSGGSGGNIIFMTGSSGVNTERARFTTTALLVNTTSALDSSAKFQVNGNVYLSNQPSGAGTGTLKYNAATGLVSYDASSRIYKKDIIELKYGLDSILKMQPKKYKWKSNDAEDLGFIADEMYNIIPEIVFLANNKINQTELKDGEPLGINYDRLGAILVKGIQELKAELDEIKTKLA